MRKLGWDVVEAKNQRMYVKKLPVLPVYVGKVQRVHTSLSVTEIRELKKGHRLINFSYEPFEIESETKGRIYFRINPYSLQLTPTKTLWLDLTKPVDFLTAHLKQKTRYNLKHATSHLKYELIKGDMVTNEQADDLFAILAQNKPYTKIFPPSRHEFEGIINSFNKDCFIVRIFKQSSPGNTLAFCLVLCTPNMAFYWHNASLEEGKRHNAPTLYVWQAILESKRRGLQVFDFEGLYDERFPKANMNWKGFSRFKEGFYSPSSI